MPQQGSMIIQRLSRSVPKQLKQEKCTISGRRCLQPLPSSKTIQLLRTTWQRNRSTTGRHLSSVTRTMKVCSRRGRALSGAPAEEEEAIRALRARTYHARYWKGNSWDRTMFYRMSALCRSTTSRYLTRSRSWKINQEYMWMRRVLCRSWRKITVASLRFDPPLLSAK